MTGTETRPRLLRALVLLVAVALALVLAPATAHAAVIVTTATPTIASGPVEGGSSTFKVTARATFEDAVPTWAEVTFIVNGLASPQYSSVQTVPGSRHVRTWNSFTCLAEGKVTVTTRWQYVGSIGSSEATSAQVDCHVGLGALLSPDAKKALGIAAAVLAIAGGLICLPATAAALGLAAAGAATLGTVGGLASLASSGISLGLLAADPVDPAYDVLVELVPVESVTVPAGGGISPGAAALLQQVATASARVEERALAMTATLDKWQGAYAAADQVWADAQAQAVHSWGAELATALNALADRADGLPAALAAAGLPDAALTPAQLRAAVDTWLDAPETIPAVAAAPAAWAAPLPRHDGETLLSWIQGTIAYEDPATLPASPFAGLAAAAPLLREVADDLASFGPLITSVAPTSGPEGGGTPATVQGQRLAGVGTVTVGGVPAGDVECTETSCTFTTPPGAGVGPIVASTGVDVSPLASAPTFSYAPSGGNLLSNGSLEGGGGFPATSNFVTVDPGPLGPWSVASRAIDVVGVDQATASRGRQFVDLNGNREQASGPGAISQTVTTVPGHLYTFSFAMAGNPNGEPTLKRLTASAGARSQEFSFDTTTVTNDTLGWVTKTMSAVSCGATMTVALASTTAGMRGPNVDDLRLVDDGVAPGSPCSTSIGWAGRLPAVTVARATARWTVPPDVVMASFQVRTRTAALGRRLGAFGPERILPGSARAVRLGTRRGGTTCVQVTAVDSLGHRATAPTRCSTLAAPDSLLRRAGAAWTVTRGLRYSDRRSLTALRKGMALTLPKARGSRVVLVVATRPGGGVLGLYVKGRLVGVAPTASRRPGRALRTVRVRLTGAPVVVRVLRPGRGATIDGFAVLP